MKLVAWCYIGLLVVALLTMPFWLWWASGDIDALYGGLLVYGVVAAGFGLAAALITVTR